MLGGCWRGRRAGVASYRTALLHPAYGPMGHHSRCFQYHHPLSNHEMHDTSTSPPQHHVCWSNTKAVRHLCLSLCVLPSITIILHPQHINQLAAPCSDPPFSLTDLPPYPSTSALFHFRQWPVQRKRKQPKLKMTKHVEQMTENNRIIVFFFSLFFCALALRWLIE